MYNLIILAENNSPIMNIMTKKRCGRKWTIPETLALQREFELLKWTIDQIAEQHGRSAEAIMRKLDQEGLADFNVLYSNYYDLNSYIPVERKYGSKTTLQLVALQEEDSKRDETLEEEEEEEETMEYVSKADLDTLTRRVAALEIRLNAMQSTVLNKCCSQ